MWVNRCLPGMSIKPVTNVLESPSDNPSDDLLNSLMNKRESHLSDFKQGSQANLSELPENGTG